MRTARAAIMLLLALLTASATACMGGDDEAARAPEAVLRDARAALDGASSARFDIRLRLRVEGEPAGQAAQLLSGPIELRLRGVATAGDAADSQADLRFRVEASGISFEGRLLTPGGRRSYVQIPAFLGPGWYFTEPGADGSGGLGAPSLPRGANPLTWFTDRESDAGGGEERVSGTLDVERLFGDLFGTGGDGLRRLGEGVRVAQGEAAFDADTHLPTSLDARIAADVPAGLSEQTEGIESFDLQVDAGFSGWNEPVSVEAPPDARRLEGGLPFLGGEQPAA
jgi:hypothetical protein